MKKLVMVIFVFVCMIGITGCNQQSQRLRDSQQPQRVQGSQLLEEGDVISIDVSSLPDGYNYSFSGEDAKAIIDYLSTLNLEGDFEENPNEYGGMTWVISLKYENEDTLTIYHFGNMFIRSEKGSWYKMTNEEASRFETLLNELNN